MALAFAVAASANLPTILYSLFWKRFNTTGALFSIYGGVILCVVLIVFSPVVSGTPSSMIRSADFAWFPLSNPGLVSIPASFVLGVIGTFLGSRERFNAARYAEMEVRSLTGAGSVRSTAEVPEQSRAVSVSSVGAIPTYGPDAREYDAERSDPAGAGLPHPRTARRHDRAPAAGPAARGERGDQPALLAAPGRPT